MPFNVRPNVINLVKVDWLSLETKIRSPCIAAKWTHKQFTYLIILCICREKKENILQISFTLPCSMHTLNTPCFAPVSRGGGRENEIEDLQFFTRV